MKFSTTLRVDREYLNAKESEATLEIVVRLWQEAANEQKKQTKMYFSAVLKNSITVHDWAANKDTIDVSVVVSPVSPKAVTWFPSCVKKMLKKLGQPSAEIFCVEGKKFHVDEF